MITLKIVFWKVRLIYMAQYKNVVTKPPCSCHLALKKYLVGQQPTLAVASPLFFYLPLPTWKWQHGFPRVEGPSPEGNTYHHRKCISLPSALLWSYVEIRGSDVPWLSLCICILHYPFTILQQLEQKSWGFICVGWEILCGGGELLLF